MSQSKIEIELLIGGPLKKDQIDNFAFILNEYVSGIEGYNFELLNYYYEDHRSVGGGLFLFLIISAIADALTIFMALRELIRKEPMIEKLLIKTDQKEIYIEGNMTDEEIINILKEGKKFE